MEILLVDHVSLRTLSRMKPLAGANWLLQQVNLKQVMRATLAANAGKINYNEITEIVQLMGMLSAF